MIAGDCQWPPRRQPLWIPSSLNRLFFRRVEEDPFLDPFRGVVQEKGGVLEGWIPR